MRTAFLLRQIAENRSGSYRRHLRSREDFCKVGKITLVLRCTCSGPEDGSKGVIEQEVFTGATSLCRKRGWEVVRTRRVSFQQKHKYIVHFPCTGDKDRVVGGRPVLSPLLQCSQWNKKPGL